MIIAISICAPTSCGDRFVLACAVVLSSTEVESFEEEQSTTAGLASFTGSGGSSAPSFPDALACLPWQLPVWNKKAADGCCKHRYCVVTSLNTLVDLCFSILWFLLTKNLL